MGILKKIIFRDKDRKGFFILTLGTLGGRLILAAALPVLTHFYSPSDMGRFGLYISFLNIVGLITSLRYDASIVATKSNVSAIYLIYLSFFFTIIMSPILGGIFFLLVHLNWLGFGQLSSYTVVFVVIAIFFMGNYETLRYFQIRMKGYKIISKVYFFQSGGRAIAQLIVGFSGLSYLGLMLGDVFGRLLGIYTLFKEFYRASKKYHSAFSIKRLYLLGWRYKDFFLFLTPSTLISNSALNLPVPLFSATYGVKVAGTYLLANMLLSLPASLIGRGYMDIFLSKASQLRLKDSQKLRQFFISSARQLFFLGIFPTIALEILAPFVVKYIFGAAWIELSKFILILAPLVFIRFIVNPISVIVFVINAQRYKLIYDILATCTLVLSIYLGYWIGFSVINTLFLLSSLRILTYIFYYFILLSRL